jgi:hypothetical protein
VVADVFRLFSLNRALPIVRLATTAAEHLSSCELHEIATITAQHFAAELRRKDGCHTQTAPFLRFVWKDGLKH